ncbi:hypothetical protein Glo7428_4856 [Gloeocapsa sp. PCC 7428]|nr:hypothetical protein Glo7428_4856 [Gloeocapsa sp. PCC 7428]
MVAPMSKSLEYHRCSLSKLKLIGATSAIALFLEESNI